jgi:hypothetical protein
MLKKPASVVLASFRHASVVNRQSGKPQDVMLNDGLTFDE